MTKPPFKPPHILSRLEAVTNTSATLLSKLEADVAWYKSALQQKSLWARQLEVDNLDLRIQNSRLKHALVVLGLLALGATLLALRKG